MTTFSRQRRLSKAEANKLSRVVTRQMVARFSTWEAEAGWAFGMRADKPSPSTPEWLAPAIRMALVGKPISMTGKPDVSDLFAGLGTIFGMAKMWKSVLNSPTPDLVDLEKIGPALTEMRESFGKLCGPSFRKIERAAKKLESLSLKPALQHALIKGQQLGSDLILNKDGSLNDDTTIQKDICFFLWIYWPQIELLGSVPQLEKFLVVEMRQDNLTRNNLEKICRDIGLKFRKRGRPKKRI